MDLAVGELFGRCPGGGGEERGEAFGEGGSLARVIEYGFDALDYRSFLVTTAEGNLRSRRLVESLGFEARGIQRDAELLHNVLVDHVVYYLRR